MATVIKRIKCRHASWLLFAMVGAATSVLAMKAGTIYCYDASSTQKCHVASAENQQPLMDTFALSQAAVPGRPSLQYISRGVCGAERDVAVAAVSSFLPFACPVHVLLPATSGQIALYAIVVLHLQM